VQVYVYVSCFENRKNYAKAGLEELDFGTCHASKRNENELLTFYCLFLLDRNEAAQSE
jgi:hypothetical protein